MSTRSIIVFKDKHYENYIYAHSDGYPSNRLIELQKFLVWNKPRNRDVPYATANFVLWYKLDTIREFNEYYSNEERYPPASDEESKQITTLEDMLEPRELDDYIHRGIGMVNSEDDDYEYKYVVDFDAKTIRVTGHERDVTVEFGQVVEFDGKHNIIKSQIPAN